MSKGDGSKNTRKKSMLLTVVDALDEDSGLGIATLNREVQRELGVNTGDIVQISFNGESAVAVVEEGKHKSASHTAISRNTHDQLGITTGEQVTVLKSSVANADRVSLRSSLKLPDSADRPKNWNGHLRNHLSGSNIANGSSVWIPLQGMECRFHVIDVRPKGVVRVTRDTEFTVEE